MASVILFWQTQSMKTEELGIDLGGDGVTANDPSDGDTGTNNLQNYPVLTSIGIDDQVISGTLHSTPSTTFKIEFFRNNEFDPSGYGEGETYYRLIFKCYY